MKTPFPLKVLAALTAGGVFAAYYAFYRRPLPRRKGKVSIQGLSGPVTLDWDSRGIPRIQAQTWLDAWRVLGWVHAQDRPFQLDLQRRVAWGRLSEIFGVRTLPADRFLRRLGLHRSAAQEWATADDQEKAMLQAYADGINAVWSQERRASEFHLLGYRPDPWQPQDSYLWVKALAHDLACNWEYEALRSLFLSQGKLDVLRLWSLTPPADMPITAGGLTQDSLQSLLQEFEAVKSCLPDGYHPTEPLAGSNAWAVSGRLSEDGFPLLANDPHLAMKLPDYWYEVMIDLNELGYHLFGVGMPGLPGLILGQNGHLAWGVTNAYIDVQDVFAERVDWSSQTVAGPSGDEPLETYQETIPVRLKKSESATYYASPRGPLLWGDPSRGDAAMSLAWTGRDSGHFFRALSGLNQARDVAQARQALADWHLPVLNFIMADREHIAHQVAGRLPRRKLGSGLLVAPAWEPGWAWQGCYDFAELPHRIDPECGYLVSANHSVASGEGQFLSWDFNPGFRAERIEELLLQRGLHNLESFQLIQCDQGSTLARRFLTLLNRLQASSPLQQDCLAALQAWDFNLRADSLAACLYQSWLAVFCEQLLTQSLGKDLAGWLLGEKGLNPLAPHASHATRYQGAIVLACLQGDNTLLPPGHTWDGFLQSSYEETLQRLEKRFGGEPKGWRWGKLHLLKMEHPLGKLGFLFPAAGPVETGGDAESPNQTGTMLVDGLPGPVSIGASWRYVVRLSDLHCRSAHCPGQSGHPGSANYRDGFAPWLAGEYYEPLQAKRGRRLSLFPSVEPG